MNRVSKTESDNSNSMVSDSVAILDENLIGEFLLRHNESKSKK